jgi:nuclear pore complex protein Nup107
MKMNRLTLHGSLSHTKASVRVLLHDWLLTSQKGTLQPILLSRHLLIPLCTEEPEFKFLREAYLPEIILAYDSVLHFSGLALSRDNFLECMELSTIIAAEDSDLAELFIRKGRMRELVAAFAENSRALLRANTPGKSRPTTPSKKLRALGWTRDLWDIKL